MKCRGFVGGEWRVAVRISGSLHALLLGDDNSTSGQQEACSGRGFDSFFVGVVDSGDLPHSICYI